MQSGTRELEENGRESGRDQHRLAIHWKSACDVVQLRSEAQFKELIGFIVADVMSEGSRRSVVHDHNNNNSNKNNHNGRHCNNNNGEITATMEDITTAIITTTLNKKI